MIILGSSLLITWIY